MTETEQQQILSDWLNEHKGIFFKIVRAYAFTPHDQDDLFQEMSLALWQSIPEFRGDAKPSTWIYRVCLFTATVWARKEKKEPKTQAYEAVAHILTQNDVVQDERLNWLYEQIGQLDPLDRSICLLMLDGFSYKEIAQIMGISESNVGVKIHRVKRELQARSEAN